MTEENPWTQCNRLMWRFGYEQRLAAWIWAARLNHCPFCNQQPHEPCVNMTDVKRFDKGAISLSDIRVTKWPHSQRVDWEKLYKALWERGYRPESEAHAKHRKEQGRLKRAGLR